MKTEAYKKYAYKALFALLSVAVMQGCAKDGNDLRTGGDEVMIRVEVDARGGTKTRGMSDGDENTVSTIDVYHFVKQSDGKYRAEDHDPAQGTFTEGPPSWINATLHTYPGRDSRLVMVVNARRADNYGYGPMVELDSFLAGLVFEETGEWYNGTTRYLPMYAITGDVEIKEGIPNGEIDNGGNPFALIRMHAKFNVRLKQPLDAGTFQLASVCVFNRKTQGFIAYDPTKLDTTVPTNPKATAPHIPSTTGNVYLPTAPYYGVGTIITDPDYGMILNKQYLFEVDNAGQSDRLDKTALVIGGRYGTDPAVTYYRVDIDVTGGNILRNRHYDVEIQSVAGSGYDTAEEAFLGTKRIDAKITDWSIGGNLISDPGTQRFLWLSDLEFEAEPDGETFTMTMETNATAWKAVVSSSATNPNAGGALWLTVSPASGGAGTYTLTIAAEANDEETEYRYGYIHVQGDNRLDAVIEVGQDFVFDIGKIIQKPFIYGYVGAFWKASQTGERLIRIPYEANMNLAQADVSGDWNAMVVEGTDWIVLDTNDSPDPGIGWKPSPSGTPDNAENYQLNSTARTVSGTCGTGTDDAIYFRIGLNSTYTPTAAEPARYGVILLTYNGNERAKALIFVRQGENPDYIMRPEDNNVEGNLHTMQRGTGTGGGTAAMPRPDARKWSPYNLTASAFNTGSATNTIQISPRSTLIVGGGGSGGGVFVNYPSQAGAFFKYAGESGAERYAYNPVIKTNIASTYSSGLWSALAATHETCPPGYRRPTEGATASYNTTGDIAHSEMRQSLYLNPFPSITMTRTLEGAGNVIWGYYADGYFDRYEITSSKNNSHPTSINSTTSLVAYIGMLYYNPYSYASLFQPAAGNRMNSDLFSTGTRVYWQSSTRYQNNSGLIMAGQRDQVSSSYHRSESATTIRCIQE